jgi:hypothetical protein
MDEDLGYPCWRQIGRFSKERHWLKSIDQRLQEYQPDIVLTHEDATAPFINYVARQGYPIFYFGRWLGKFDAGFVMPDALHPIANSPFTASHIAQFTRNEVAVVLPFIALDEYRVTKRERRYITFINPIPQKGS